MEPTLINNFVIWRVDLIYMLESKHRSLIIREFRTEDKPEVELVAKKVFNGSMDSYWSVRYLDKCDKAFVAQLNGKIVGVVELGIKKLKSGLHGQIGYIFVDPNYRRIGVGSKLLEKSLEYMVSKGVEHVWALTDKDNLATRALFKKFGFTEYSSPKDLRKFLPKSDIFRLMRWMIYWVGDVILHKQIH